MGKRTPVSFVKIFSFSLWFDPGWWAARRQSWKLRRWYIARIPTFTTKGKAGRIPSALSLQTGPLTWKFLIP